MVARSLVEHETRVYRTLGLYPWDQQGARRENILYGSLADEQRRCGGKDPQPCGLSLAGWAQFDRTDGEPAS